MSCNSVRYGTNALCPERRINMRVVGSSQNISSNRGIDRDLRSSSDNRQDVKGDKTEINGKSVYAGDLNMNQDYIANKKALGHKQAIKTILDTFSRELDLDGGVDELKEKQDALRADTKECQDKLDSVHQMKEGLRKAYGITDDSAEQEDMDLFEKANNAPGALTEEEKARLEEISPMADFYKEMSECNKMESFWTKRISNANQSIANINRTIDNVQLERLKTHAVLDARKEAEAIMENTSKEVSGLLLNEAVENTDKELEEDTKENTPQNPQKNEDLQNESVKPSQEDPSVKPSLEEVAKKQEELLLKLKKQAQKSGMMMEDLKGILVDAQY